jgi:hypothetical protein
MRTILENFSLLMLFGLQSEQLNIISLKKKNHALINMDGLLETMKTIVKEIQKPILFMLKKRSKIIKNFSFQICATNI